MPVKYKVVSTNQPGQGKEGEKMWFPKLTGSSQLNLRDIAERLSERSSASTGDVYMIIMGLVDILPELLGNGYTIKLDDFGTFRLHAKVETAKEPEKVTSRYIKGYRISFRPGKLVKNALKGIKAEKLN